MNFNNILKGYKVLQYPQPRRSHHIYRPITYCDWHKPENEIYYQLKCPTVCPKPVCKPLVVVEKSCKLCSFLEQLRDRCCGFLWPIPPMPLPSTARVHICKDIRKNNVTAYEAQKRLHKCTFPLNDCYDIPDCPEPNWEAVRPTQE